MANAEPRSRWAEDAHRLAGDVTRDQRVSQLVDQVTQSRADALGTHLVAVAVLEAALADQQAEYARKAAEARAKAQQPPTTWRSTTEPTPSRPVSFEGVGNIIAGLLGGPAIGYIAALLLIAVFYVLAGGDDAHHNLAIGIGVGLGVLGILVGIISGVVRLMRANRGRDD